MPLPDIQFRGCLAASPELVRAQEGGKLRAKLRVACNHKWTDDAGRECSQTTWLDVTAWDRVAAQVDAAGLQKGSWIYGLGQLRQWTAQGEDGAKSTRYDVTLRDLYLLPPKVQ